MAKRASAAVEKMCAWVGSLHEYHQVSKDVKEKFDHLEIMSPGLIEWPFAARHDLTGQLEESKQPH